MIQKQNIIQGATILALVVLVSGIFAPLASAATDTPDRAFNFVVSPPSLGLEAKPGEPITADVRIQNQGNATETVKASLMKFTADGETGLPKLKDLGPTDDFGKWAQLSPTVFTAEPNVWKTVKVTIAPPKDAAFGYYYAVVFSRNGAEKQIQAKKANLLGAVASLILLDVKAPGAVRKINVAEFSTNNNNTEFLPVKFNVRLHNTGNTHVGVRGTITISQHNKSVAQIDVNSSKGYILPQSYRSFTAKWEDGTPIYKAKKDAKGNAILDTSGNPKQQLIWDNFSKSKLRFGKYDARMVMIYDDGQGDVSSIATLSFWVIPWRIIGVIVAVSLFFLAGLWALVIRPLRGSIKKTRGHDFRRQG